MAGSGGGCHWTAKADRLQSALSCHFVWWPLQCSLWPAAKVRGVARKLTLDTCDWPISGSRLYVSFLGTRTGRWTVSDFSAALTG
jgi:hypothetical protein